MRSRTVLSIVVFWVVTPCSLVWLPTFRRNLSHPTCSHNVVKCPTMLLHNKSLVNISFFWWQLQHGPKFHSVLWLPKRQANCHVVWMLLDSVFEGHIQRRWYQSNEGSSSVLPASASRDTGHSRYISIIKQVNYIPADVVTVLLCNLDKGESQNLLC
jgi:hypothetical protein